MLKKAVPVALAALFVAGIARAEGVAEPIPPDYIQQFAPLAVGLFQQQFPNPPVKVDPNAEKAFGYHIKEKLGALVFPDKNVTAKMVEEATDKDVPVGILTTLSLTLETKDKVVPVEELAIADLNGQLKLPVFFLSVKAEGDAKVLTVYSKDGKPLGTSALKKQAGDPNQAVGLKLSNIDEEKRKLDATVSIGGAYESTLKLTYVKL